MAHSRAREEPCSRGTRQGHPVEGADEQDEDSTNTNRKRTVLEHCEDAMDEHATLGMFLTQ